MKAFQSNVGGQCTKARRVRKMIARVLAVVSAMTLASQTHAINVSLTATDPGGSPSFNTAGNWSNAAPPSAGNAYFTQNFVLRTPDSASSFTFAGDSLELNSGGTLAFKTGGAGVITINDFRMNGGQVSNFASSGGNTVTLAGNINVLSTSTFNAGQGSDGRIIQVRSAMTGVGGINISSSTNAGGIVSYDTLVKNYDGTTTINTGAILRQGLANALPNGAGKGILVNNGTFRLNNFNSVINGLSGNGIVENEAGAAGTETLTLNVLSGSNTFTGTLRDGNGVGTDGTLALTKNGAGVQVLSGNNTYTGQTVVNDGILRIASNTALGATAGNTRITGNTTNDGVVELTGGITTGETFLLDARQAATQNIPALSNLSGNNIVTAQVQGQTGGNAYNIESQAGLLTLQGGFTLVNTPAGTRNLQLMGAGDGNVSGAIVGGTGDVAIQKSGTGTWTLSSGANTYGGLVTINEGSLIITNNSALGSTANGVFINGAGGAANTESTLRLNNVDIGTEAIRMLSNAATDRSAIRTNGGTNTIGGDILLQGTAGGVNMILSDHILNLNGNVTLAAGAAVTTQFRGSGTGNINGLINLGTAAFNKTDNGTWNINTAGHTWGATVVAVGTLNLGIDDALPTGTFLAIGQNDATSATFNLNGFDQTVGGLGSTLGTGGTKQITNASLTPATLTVNNSANNTYGGQINGNLALTKNNTGILTLTAPTTYTGDTTINQGTLALTGSGALGGTPVISIANGAFLNVSATASTYHLLNGQTLINNGTVIGDLITDAGSNISPGLSIGLLNFNNALDINGNLTIEIDPTGPGSVDMINVLGLLDVTDSLLTVNILGPLDDAAYIFAKYGSLAGTFNPLNVSFSINPVGYEIRYNFQGNNIALVQIPEPASIGLLGLAGAALLRRRRAVA
ncbi:MAG: autotransporter-associated beta strand repeat-containing protein [Phycisphaeraceae bacterium]